MISFLRGTLKEASPPSIIIDVAGVGHEVFVTDSVVYSMSPKIGLEVEVFTYHHIRENSLDLYGFSFKEERSLFKSLLSVSGVGPKMALSILNASSANVLVRSIAEQDSSMLTKISGIGSKKAQKIILELKDKYIESAEFINNASDIEVAEALENIGYPRSKIRKALMGLPKDETSIEERVKAAIKEISKYK